MKNRARTELYPGSGVLPPIPRQDRIESAAAPRAAPLQPPVRVGASLPGLDEGDSASKLRDQLGWQPRETFESGMRRTVQWYLDHRTWSTAVKADSYAGQRLGLAPNASKGTA